MELSTSPRNAALQPPPGPPHPFFVRSLPLPSLGQPSAPSQFSRVPPCPLSLPLAPSSRPLPAGVSPSPTCLSHRLIPRGGSVLGCARVGAPHQLRVAALTPPPPPPPPSAAQPAPRGSSAVHSPPPLRQPRFPPAGSTRSEPPTPAERVMSQSAPGRRGESERR